MTVYNPDNWVIIEFNVTGETFYKVLGGWSGGYLGSDSWRMNSGIVKHDFDGDYWSFYGSSGSCYKCYVDSYGLRKNNAYVWDQLESKYSDRVRLLNDQEWIKQGWDWRLKE